MQGGASAQPAGVVKPAAEVQTQHTKRVSPAEKLRHVLKGFLAFGHIHVTSRQHSIPR